ncbi:hypothetical protein BGZ61DRAFT_446321 [Ilyonectria robusta]|uniref:uncharacterized protein n=1 Tax=Ilyonectria robusta TaxID=1079257 RepID=UPI001E8E38D3|nr:uncharacterized protein BGZ61DRAFT_446321 [Ilyonectria robusta]KAH8729402.1 hypothetical protein BGZ61DRAFT_446321 [Ilyonectria robusta]
MGGNTKAARFSLRWFACLPRQASGVRGWQAENHGGFCALNWWLCGGWMDTYWRWHRSLIVDKPSLGHEMRGLGWGR